MKIKSKRNISLKAKSYKLKASSGFSIVETIVAIAILAIAIVGPLSLAQRGLNASIYARDQVAAFYLAQEAIEYVRNVRDNNNLIGHSGSDDWLRGLEDCTNQTCGLDVTASPPPTTVICELVPLDSRRCELVFNATTGVYGDFGVRADSNWALPSGWKATQFTRKLQITPFTIRGGSYPAAADVVATVSWKTGSFSKSLSLNEKIFDWYPAPAQ